MTYPIGFRAILEIIHRCRHAVIKNDAAEAKRLSDLATNLEKELPEAAAMMEDLYGEKEVSQ